MKKNASIKFFPILFQVSIDITTLPTHGSKSYRAPLSAWQAMTQMVQQAIKVFRWITPVTGLWTLLHHCPQRLQRGVRSSLTTVIACYVWTHRTRHASLRYIRSTVDYILPIGRAFQTDTPCLRAIPHSPYAHANEPNQRNHAAKWVFAFEGLGAVAPSHVELRNHHTDIVGIGNVCIYRIVLPDWRSAWINR